MVLAHHCALWALPNERNCSDRSTTGCRYYAAPTMHQLIIAEASRDGTAGRHRLRLIGNAAGPLLPSLANSLKSTFWYVLVSVLLSYLALSALSCYAFPARSHLGRPVLNHTLVSGLRCAVLKSPVY